MIKPTYEQLEILLSKSLQYINSQIQSEYGSIHSIGEYELNQISEDENLSDYMKTLIKI